MSDDDPITTFMHDDLPGVMVSYGSPPARGLGAAAYQLTTSGTMTGLIVSMIGGVLALVVSLLLGPFIQVAIGVAAAAALGAFVALAAMTIRFYLRVQASLPVPFPTHPDDTMQPRDSMGS